MDRNALVEKTAQYVKGRLDGEASGHDWHHVLRVMRMATHIAGKEGADLFSVQMAALLHDLDDWKFREDGESGPREAREWLESLGLDSGETGRICSIIEGISFRGAGVETPMETLEGKVVQDADRLDAIGAVGIGRAFAYGGRKGRLMHDPDSKPSMHKSFEDYKAGKGTTVNHFYEKLLLLKDRMNTETGKKMAAERHAFLEIFLQRFLEEWKG
ncbi:MAG TPA: HD domain-containing protein [Candidatus Bilamarchaeum sp.]|nr:HD domain-containing protein [Candidatus Bilamarchaeum sp.]